MPKERLAATALHRAGVFAAIHRLRKGVARTAEIVTYHRVAPRSDGIGPFLEPVEVDLFKQHLDFFARSYELVPLDLLVDCVRTDRAWPRNALAITFDDAYRDVYEWAFPELVARAMTATLFVPAGSVDRAEPLWWDRVYRTFTGSNGWIPKEHLPESCPARVRSEWPSRADHTATEAAQEVISLLSRIPDPWRRALVEDLVDYREAELDPLMSWRNVQDLSEAGFTIGAHTMDHPSLDRVEAMSAVRQIQDSKRLIEERIGRPADVFAYPAGSGRTRPVVREALEGCGFLGAVTNQQAANTLSTDPYSLSRRSIPNRPVPSVQGVLSGVLEIRESVRTALGMRRSH